MPRLGRRDALQNAVLKGAARLRSTVEAARDEQSRDTLLAELEAMLKREIAAEKKTPIPCRRKRKREVQDVDGQYSSTLAEHPGQIGHLDFEDFRDALDKLPADQREALILICASGFSYEEAAEICECAVGTMKSRVNRARNRLSEILSVDSAEEFGPDQSVRAAVTASPGGMEKISAMD